MTNRISRFKIYFTLFLLFSFCLQSQAKREKIQNNKAYASTEYVGDFSYWQNIDELIEQFHEPVPSVKKFNLLTVSNVKAEKRNAKCPYRTLGESHIVALKVESGGFIELPAFTDLKQLTVHLSKQSSNVTPEVRIEEQQGKKWKTVTTLSEMSQENTCSPLRVPMFRTGVSVIRLLNTGSSPVYVWGIEVDSAQDEDYPYDSSKPDAGITTGVNLEKPGIPWQSDLLKLNADNTLTYHADGKGQRLPDFSHAGYERGNTNYPTSAVVKIVTAQKGDNTQTIQEAIDEIGKKPKDARGIRGIVQLSAGLYDIWGTIHIRHDGVILRGSGNGNDPKTSTILYGRGKSNRDLLVMGNVKKEELWNSGLGANVPVLDEVVPVGCRKLTVDLSSDFKEGDPIVIRHRSSEKWLQAINYGEVGDNLNKVKPWREGTMDILYARTVAEIEKRDNKMILTLDAPVFYTLQKELTEVTVRRYKPQVTRQVAVENLRLDNTFASPTDEDHVTRSLSIMSVEEGWVKDVVALHFVQAGFYTEGSRFVTIENCKALDPVGIVTGSRMYNFFFSLRSQFILIKDCYARGGRHNFVASGIVTCSGNVVLNCTQELAKAQSECHQRFSQGILFDNLTDFNRDKILTTGYTLGFHNRFNMGSGHGWSAVNCVFWNCRTTSGVYCEEPPTGQNYCIGTLASKVTAFKKTIGYIERIGSGEDVFGLEPRSLYLAQLKARLQQEK